MVKSANSRAKRFGIALIVGAGVGAMVGGLIRDQLNSAPDRQKEPSGTAEDSTFEGAAGEAVSIEKSSAWRYAVACRDGNWTEVLALTEWVQARLAFVEQSEGADGLAAEQERLIRELGTRTLEDNRLSDEGVEDQYVFSPGATIEYDSVDNGRDDLDVATARRIWLKVSYPTREKALLDREGVPIRSVIVGINVSPDGHVLKANVFGNLDIDWSSIKYDWPNRA